jgi:hypothetical protein
LQIGGNQWIGAGQEPDIGPAIVTFRLALDLRSDRLSSDQGEDIDRIRLRIGESDVA